MLNYTVISNDNYGDFTLDILKKIIEGWKLQGGICVVFRENSTDEWYEYFQAIVKEVNPTETKDNNA